MSPARALGERRARRPAARRLRSPIPEAGTPERGRSPSAAVVIGLDCATGLQTARILAGYGISVIGIAKDPGHPCCRTRACATMIAADTTGSGLIETLESLGRTLAAPAVLVPCTDLSVLLVSRHRAALSDRFHFALPDPDVAELLVDKARFYAFAQQEGLPIPRTVLLDGPEDALEAARTLRFPAVLKPAVKTVEWKRLSGAKAYRVGSPEELLRLYDRFALLSGCLIAQEWIAGEDSDHYTCNAYFGRDGEPLVTFTTRKLRQWPPFGGEACLGVECRDDTVVRETVRLFRTVGLRGLGYLEMKRDAHTGEYLIIEPNIGRPTGRSATAEAAGVELLHTMYCDILDLPLPTRRQQSFRGVKWIHLRRDLQSALHHWWRGELTISEWLVSLRGPKTEALFSWRDPVPFWADLGRVGLQFLRKSKHDRSGEDGR